MTRNINAARVSNVVTNGHPEMNSIATLGSARQESNTAIILQRLIEAVLPSASVTPHPPSHAARNILGGSSRSCAPRRYA
jgi:hypothetical protein